MLGYLFGAISEMERVNGLQCYIDTESSYTEAHPTLEDHLLLLVCDLEKELETFYSQRISYSRFNYLAIVSRAVQHGEVLRPQRHAAQYRYCCCSWHGFCSLWLWWVHPRLIRRRGANGR
jgi:hypothetical protein